MTSRRGLTFFALQISPSMSASLPPLAPSLRFLSAASVAEPAAAVEANPRSTSQSETSTSLPAYANVLPSVLGRREVRFIGRRSFIGGGRVDEDEDEDGIECRLANPDEVVWRRWLLDNDRSDGETVSGFERQRLLQLRGLLTLA